MTVSENNIRSPKHKGNWDRDFQAPWGEAGDRPYCPWKPELGITSMKACRSAPRSPGRIKKMSRDESSLLKPLLGPSVHLGRLILASEDTLPRALVRILE